MITRILEDACLPHSHYCLHPTTGLWDLAADWLAGRDPGMDAIASALKSSAGQ